jgi:arginine/lysine/ornithine decarboxylase
MFKVIASGKVWLLPSLTLLLQVLQTSSPSYLLLASLDAARRHAAAPGTWDTPLAAAAAARARLQATPGLTLLQAGSCGSDGSVAGWDPLRLVVNVSGLGLGGFAAAEWLEQQHSIVPELATAQVGGVGCARHAGCPMHLNHFIYDAAQIPYSAVPSSQLI